ncbi:MAG TPA: tetratricopeptide repeat protein [Oculatellaceae cyanobacterium]
MTTQQQLTHENPLAEWESLVNEGNSLFDEKRYAQAEIRFVSALRIVEKATTAEVLSTLAEDEQVFRRANLAKSLNNMAAIYHAQGKYTMADDLWQRCLTLKQELFGPKDLEIAVVLHNLAALNSAKRNYAKAEELYVEAREIKELHLGMLHPDLIPLLENYALLLRKQERLGEAQQLAERVMAIQSKLET